MNKLSTLFFSIVLIMAVASCNKKEENAWDGDTTSTYTVEGFLLKPDNAPNKGLTIALCQSGDDNIRDQDTRTVTDSQGYFRLQYVPQRNGRRILLYRPPQSYTTIYSVQYVMRGLDKGRDLHLGNVYYQR